MENAIEIFAAINFVIIGLSHIFQHRAWAEFFVLLSKQGRAGVFAHGFLTLITGSLIVAFHSVWTGIPVVLTIIGWGFVLKSAIVFTYPEWGLRSMSRVQPANSRGFCIVGIIMVILAALLGFSLWHRIAQAA